MSRILKSAAWYIYEMYRATLDEKELYDSSEQGHCARERDLFLVTKTNKTADLQLVEDCWGKYVCSLIQHDRASKQRD